MSRLRDFVIALPRLCGVENPEDFAKGNELMFDHEVSAKGSVFAKREGVDIERRLLPAFGFRVCLEVDEDAAEYAMELLMVASMAHDGQTDDALTLAAELETVEDDYPEIKAMYTVQEALQGQWS